MQPTDLRGRGPAERAGRPLPPRPVPHRRGLGFGLLAMAAAIATNSLLGPLGADLIRYPLPESVLNQTIGLELVSLAVMVPWAVVAGALTLRRHPAGPVLGFAPALYTGYMFVQYLVGPGYLYYPGALLLHLGLFILGGVVAVAAWSACDHAWLVAAAGPAARRWAVVLLALAGFVLFRYVPVVADALAGDPIPADAAGAPGMFWSILWLDLGIVVPATVATAVGLLRRAAWAGTALYAVVGWFALVPVSVAAMAIVMLVNDDPHAATGDAVVLTVAAAGFAVVTWLLYRKLFAQLPPAAWRRRSRSPGRTGPA